MGKKGNWFSAVKKAFRSSTKEASPPAEPPKRTSKEEETRRVKDKRRWSFGKSARVDSANQQGKSEDLSEKSLIQVEQKSNKHALAIAAATAAAAEAAVAAAHAAAEVVRLTGNMQAGRPSSYGCICSEDWAAVKIQTAFRGYLARRALRALRGLVRLQALVRGHTVRRQATLTLRCMQALVRVQACVRARRVRMSEEGQAVQRQIWQRRQHEMLTQKANPDGGQDMHMWNDSLRSMEEVEAKKLLKQEAALKRERALAYAFSHQLWRSPPGDSSPKLYIDIGDSIDKPRWGWSWLERWMAARPWEASMFEKETMGLITSMENQLAIKSLGSNTSKPNTAPNTKMTLPSSNVSSMQNANMELTPKKKPSTPKDPMSGAIKGLGNGTTTRSPMSSSTVNTQRPISVKTRPASPRGVAARLSEEGGSGMSTSRSAQSIYSAAGARFHFHNRKSSMAGSSVRDDDSLVSSPSIPSYMAATQSARAKARSLSSPKQRRGGETPEREQQSNAVYARKRLSFPSINTDTVCVKEELGVASTALLFNKRPIQRSPSMKSCSVPANNITSSSSHSGSLEALAH